MKKPISQLLVNRKLFIALLLILMGTMARAQWTFTFQLSQSGPCPAGVPLPVIPTFPNLGFPTQSQCESLRQQALAIRESYPVYNDGKYLGDCSLFYVCTACVGSDLPKPGQNSIPGQIAIGDVSINGLLEGKPLFVPHQSQAFEEWSSEYKQLLASYGITSILGADFKFPRIPLTDDRPLNIVYMTLSSGFRPMIRPAITPKPASDAVPKKAPPDPPKTEPTPTPTKEFPAIVMPIMGDSPMTQDERERQNLQKEFGQQYIDAMTYIRPESGIEESTPPTNDLSESQVYGSVDGMLDKISKNPNGALAAYIGKIELSIEKNVFKYLYGAKDALASGKEEEFINNNPNAEQTILIATATDLGKSKLKSMAKEVETQISTSVNGALVKSGEKIMSYAYGTKGVTDYKNTLNVIGSAQKIQENIKNVKNWWDNFNSENH